MLNTIEGAVAFANQAHDGQVDKQGVPYILHPLRVGASLYKFGTDYVIAGILHDVVEDTLVTLEDLHILTASDAVVAAVGSVTKTESERTWEAYEKSLERAVADPIGGWVKAADVADNRGRLDLDRMRPDDYWRLLDKYGKARTFLQTRGFDPDDLTPVHELA